MSDFLKLYLKDGIKWRVNRLGGFLTWDFVLEFDSEDSNFGGTPSKFG